MKVVDIESIDEWWNHVNLADAELTTEQKSVIRKHVLGPAHGISLGSDELLPVERHHMVALWRHDIDVAALQEGLEKSVDEIVAETQADAAI